MDDYLMYKKKVVAFIKARNKSIAKYVKQLNSQ
jgi:hypothetical protein